MKEGNLGAKKGETCALTVRAFNPGERSLSVGLAQARRTHRALLYHAEVACMSHTCSATFTTTFQCNLLFNLDGHSGSLAL